MSAAPFSRLQLAAALLEYDNDSTNPHAPYRSAHESAIFAPLRRMKPIEQKAASRASYISVPLPSDSASVAGGRSVAVESRRSRASVSALKNMFGEDHVYDDDGGSEIIEEEEELDVDLASWGIDNLLTKHPPSSASKKPPTRSMSNELPNPHSVDDHSTPLPRARDVGARRRPANTRTRSLGNFDAILDEMGPPLHRSDTRRASFGSPLDLAGMETPAEPFKPLPDDPDSDKPIPFPSYNEVDPAGRSVSQLAHYRTQSTASIGSRMLAENPRAMERTYSTASGAALQEDNPFAIRAPSVMSRFDPKSHARTMSNASMGTHMMLDQDDGRSMASRPLMTRAPSTLDLLRPKVLVMPSPLQPIDRNANSQVRTTDGFEVSIGGTPLPPGASGARKSTFLPASDSAPDPAQLFTPNPRANMTLSQLTFRNNLMVGGQRDPAYVDIDGVLGRATEDGQQIEWPADEEVITPESEAVPGGKPYRPAGKLYGKSLIDDLEARKAEMRGKQRVFTGDQRPSMMQRGSSQRPGTFIDPASLVTRPDMQRMSSFGIQPATDVHRQSTLKPLLNFEGQENVSTPPLNKLVPTTRSVFGVDTLWERETAKLREMEALEKEEEEKRNKLQEEQDARKGSKKKRKGKGAVETSPLPVQTSPTEPDLPKISMAPPVLPDIDKPSAARPPPVADDDDDAQSDESAEEARLPPTARKPSTETKRWFAGDSDEEEQPQAQVKTIGTGPRFQSTPRALAADSDSDEDIPLSTAVTHAIKRQRNAPQLASALQDESDEDKPLNVILEEQSKASLFNVDFDGKAPQDDEEDDKPLGLRASRFVPPAGAGDDDDDKPLAFHPEQQRRTQYLTLQQQQQQQMMMQAQMHNSMFYPAPSLIGFPPPIMMAPVAPVQIPSPPPPQDPVKFGRVDKWRRDVVVEGEP